MKKYITDVKLLYDSEGIEIWHIEGKHDLNIVRRKLEEIIDLQEEFIDTSPKILPKTW
jgi:hypothetical protein